MATTDQKDLSIQMVHIDDQKDVHQLYPKTKDKNVTIESTNKALPTGITTLKDVVDKLGDSAFSSSTVIGITADERNKLKGIEAGAQVNMVDGVKGDAETYYRTGDINITKANIGLGSVENKSSATIRSEITSQNVTSALGYTPPKQDTTYTDATTTNHGLMSTDDKIKLDGIAPGAQVNSITGIKGDSESTYRTGNVNITKANVGLGNVENKSSATIRGELTSANVTSALGYAPPRVNTTYEPATTDTDGLLSSDDKTKLDSIEAGAQKNTVTGVKGYNESAYRTGAIVITKDNVGLGNVENKSSATIRGELTSSNVTTALGYTPPKQDTTYPPANGSTLGLIKTGGGLTLTNGVATVNNNSHSHTIANITNLQSSLDSKLNTSLKGAKNGLATLDENGFVPSSQLPSYVDDVVEVNMGSDLASATLADDSPVTPETGKIYVDLVSNKTYRWSGTSFVVISETLALGETSSTAFDGARGKVAYNHSQSAHARTDATLTQSSTTNGNIKINGTETKVYTHPSYTAQKSGLYKVTVDASGHVSAVAAVTKADITALGIPGQDTNTTYDVATTSTNGLLSSTDKAKLDGIASGANKYTHPGYTSRTSGLYKITVDSMGHVSAVASVTKSDITALGIPGQDTTYGTMTGATANADGAKGLVPAPAKGDSSRYLRSDGTWVTPPNTTYNDATTSTHGLMSTSDKAKLDAIASGANRYVHPSYTAYDSGFYKVSVDSTGHVAAAVAVSKSDITSLGIPGQDTTYGDATTSAHGLMTTAMVSKLNGIASGANNYTHPGYTSHASGLYKVTVDGTGHVSAVASVTKADLTALGIPSSNTTYGTMTGATSDTDGSTGLVPAPAKGAATRYLRSDGTWVTPPNTTYGMASSTSNGLMSSTDKAKLDTIASGANNYTHPSYTSRTSGLYKITVDGTGHVSAVSSVTKADITALGIPGQDTNTTYGVVSSSSNGLMSPTMLNTLNSVNSAIGGKYSSSGGTLNGDITFPAIDDTGSSKGINWSGSTDGARIYYKTTAKDAGHLVFQATDDANAVIDFEWNIEGTVSRKSYISSDGVYHGTATYASSAGSANSVAWDNVTGKPGTYYTHPSYTAHSAGLYKVTVDSTGHVSAVSNVTKADITNLGIPGSNTWRGIQDNLTSTATDQSLSANQGKILKSLVDGKYDSGVSRTANTVLAAPNGSNGSASFRKLVAADIPSLTRSKISDLGTAATKNIGDFAINTLLTNQNLNDITSPGFYNAGGGNTVTNKPSGVEHFGLQVIHRASGAYYTQKIYSDTAQYTRKCVNGAWGSWTEDKLTDTNTTYSTATQSANGLMSAADKKKLDGIAAGANKYTYTLPTASASTLGGIKVGTNLSISNGVLSSTNTWRGIQNNLTSDSTTDSLSAAQGKALKSLVDGKAAANHTHPYISTSVNYVLITDETNLTAYDASSAKWNAPS